MTATPDRPEAGRSVVILEPDDLHGPLVQRLFAELGWRAVWADRPSAALRTLHDGPAPDLLLIAGQPSHDVAMMARMIVDAVPVLYMSASVFRSRPPQADEAGVLAKPFSLEELASMAERAIEVVAVPAR